MAIKSFTRKRKPAGLTTSYELKDHMVATGDNNAYLNPHPQYVLRSELVSAGGDTNLALHMADPGAHANYYVQIANITHDYNLDNTNKVTSAKAVYLFYQKYLAHNHDTVYAMKEHTHDNILTTESINEHNQSPQAHPGLWVRIDHIVVNADSIPVNIDNTYVPSFTFFNSLRDQVFSHEAGNASGDAATGPASNNPLRYAFAARIHSHSYSDVGAAPTNHNHDSVYSKLNHNHDGVYSFIHSHPYLEDTVLESVGIYPNMLVEKTVVEENPDYDPEDAMSEQYITTLIDLNEMTTQGFYQIDSTPVAPPERHVVLSADNLTSLIGKTFKYVNDVGTVTSVVLSSSNAGVLFNQFGTVACTTGSLVVKKATVATIDDTVPTSSTNNTFVTVEQIYTDVSGAMLRRVGSNRFTVETYVLTTDTLFVEGVNYYTLSGETYTLATVVVGDAVPADTYYTEDSIVEEYVWSDWLEYGNEIISAPSLSNRLWTSESRACKCCFSKTDGANHMDFQIPTYLQAHISKINASVEVLLECVSSNGTYGYSLGDHIVDPICSNKANNESSFLGHAQTVITTVANVKVARLFLPLVWYAKVCDADAEPGVTLTSSNVYKYYRRSFTYTNNGTPTTVMISSENASDLVGLTGDIAAMVYGSKTIPVASQAECAEWNIKVRVRY